MLKSINSEKYTLLCHFLGICVLITAGVQVFAYTAPLYTPDEERFTAEDARRMISVGEDLLAPVYAPLAEQIVEDYGLARKENGIGIDLGAGHGKMTLELCRRTWMHWVNADINPHFFPYFYEQAQARGLGHRVSAIFADAHALPFRDNYADIIVSRGSYHFWEDKALAFREIVRVLKPGAVAYIGRGFARDMPVEIAYPIRERQGDRMVYDRSESATELMEIFSEIGIEKYQIDIPVPEADEALNYGIWVEFRKPESAVQRGNL